MKQPTTRRKSSSSKKSVSSKGRKPFYFRKRRPKNKQYGTSKLERDFANDFLDKMGLVYVYQYEAKDIKRFYDFAITCDTGRDYLMEDKDGVHCVKQEGQYFEPDLLIEIDGDYYHANPNQYKDNCLSPMQKHNRFVDKLKDYWAGMHCITLLRFWEYDIRHNPKKIFDEMSKYVKIQNKRHLIKENKKKPH